MRVPRFAVVATHNRPKELAALVAALDTQQCDHIVIIDNASTPPVSVVHLAEEHAIEYADVWVIRDEEQPPNLSRLWNLGLQLAADMRSQGRRGPWDVAVLNDDADVPHGWFDTVCAALRDPWREERGTRPAVAHTHTYGDPNRPAALRDEHSPMDLVERMCPWAFVARGELGLRFDEELRWWWGDTAFELAARRAGGVLAVPGPQVVNALANTTTVGVLAEQAGRDRATFERKYGKAPW